MTWTVYASWQAYGILAADETATVRPTWLLARREARHLACLNGVRYVSVQGPDGVVCGEYDRYTNRWREYVAKGER